MAANNFAPTLHKNCRKIVVALVYAVLEWILILLLLLNSLFSYLIAKFAEHFGLKPSCTWCSRLDFNLDHVCEAHGTEISKLSYCYSHKRLAESRNLCCDCSFSRPAHHGMGTVGEISSRIDFFTWVDESVSEENRCSCCGEILSRKAYTPPLLFRSSWDVLDYVHKKASVAEVIDADNEGVKASETMIQSKSSSQADQVNLETESGEERRDDHSDALECHDPLWGLGCNEGYDESLYITDMLLQNAGYDDSDRFICIELIDTAPTAGQKPLTSSLQDTEEEYEEKQLASFELAKDHSAEAAFLSVNDGATHRRHKLLEGSHIDTTDVALPTPTRERDFPEAERKDYEMLSGEVKSKITCPGPDAAAQVVGATILQHSSGAEPFVADSTNIELFEDHKSDNHDKQVDEERCSPEVMISESLHQLHKKLIMLEKEGLGVDCFDGSVTSEMEVDGEFLTTDHLKATVKAQQKALNALYAELEEERKAADVAANETMAMIRKLQEEKAAMQMEALQYQRMMEEQAEYDQEALQLLNDLMIKREKEKQELEKELEMYRNKVLDDVAGEKIWMVRSRKGSFSSGQGKSNSGDSTDRHVEDEYDIRQEYNLDDALEDMEEIGVDSVAHSGMLDTSLVEFDEERLSLLEELKDLEAKLLAMHENEMQLSAAQDLDGSYGICSPEEKGLLHTSTGDPDEKNHVDRAMDPMAKKLLPLLDSTDNEFAEEEIIKEEIRHSSLGTDELEVSKIVIHEELGHVYERLQALEADKEFLRHCISSMMKGNKGLPLLQEILQHLRDLRSVELSARNLPEIPLADVSMPKEDEE